MKKETGNYIDYFIMGFVSIIYLYFILHLGNAIELTKNGTQIDMGKAFPMTFENMENEYFSFFKTLFIKNSYTRTVFLYTLIPMFMIGVTYFTTNKNYRRNKEHGSSRFGRINEYKKLANKKEPEKNIILAQKIQVSGDMYKTGLNLNVLCIGGSGSGKTRGFIKPNLMQMNGGSYIVSDPKGEIVRSCGELLKKNDYTIKILNLADMKHSDMYNPFKLLRKGKEEDVMTLINTLMINTTGSKAQGSDPFWEKAEMLFLQSLFYYVISEFPPEDRCIGQIMELLRAVEINEDNQDGILDCKFKKLEEKNRNHIAVKQYRLFKISSGKTAKSIVISAGARLAPFNIKSVADLTNTDTLNLSDIATKKTALFIITPPTNTTFNFIASMLYTQLFTELDYQANWKYKGRLKNQVTFLLDEFSNIGRIPNFEKILSYARSLNISVNPVFQSLSQLKEMYKNNYETIIDNCDTLIFLGGQGTETLKFISEKLGKETIDTTNRSVSKGRNQSFSRNEGILGRALMTSDEISAMSHRKCIVFIRGYYPYFGDKYSIKTHKNYSELDEKTNNIYDIKKNKNVISKTIEPIQREEFELYGENENAVTSLLNDLKISNVKNTDTLGQEFHFEIKDVDTSNMVSYDIEEELF